MSIDVDEVKKIAKLAALDVKDEDIQFGRGIRVRQGSNATIAVIGSQLRNALLAADKLSTKGISVEVLYFHTIKPFDFELVRESVAKTKRLLTVEELSAHDGIFNLCLRACLGLNEIAMSQIAIDDFVHGYGSYEELCARLGMSSDVISISVVELTNSKL